jgi:hypothetical protein
VATENKKPHKFRIKSGGEIDAGCDGKNAWDDAVRGYVPKMIDMSVIHWEEHKPETLQKLRDTLDAEFEYVDHELCAIGFRNAIKRFLKTDRSRLKSRYLAGNDQCPPHVQPWSWESLKAYWMTDLQQEKVAKMANARKQVKNYSSVGRKGRDGLEAQLVRLPPLSVPQILICFRTCDLGEATFSTRYLILYVPTLQKKSLTSSPGITELANAMQGSEATGLPISVSLSTFLPKRWNPSCISSAIPTKYTPCA